MAASRWRNAMITSTAADIIHESICTTHWRTPRKSGVTLTKDSRIYVVLISVICHFDQSVFTGSFPAPLVSWSPVSFDLFSKDGKWCLWSLLPTVIVKSHIPVRRHNVESSMTESSWQYCTQVKRRYWVCCYREPGREIEISIIHFVLLDNRCRSSSSLSRLSKF